MNFSEHIKRYGLFTFLLATSIGFASVNTATLAIIPLIRVVSFGVLVVCVYVLLLRPTIRLDTLVALCLILGFYFVGLAQGLGNLVSIDFLPLFARSLLLVAIGAFLLTNPIETAFRRRFAMLFVSLSVVILALHLATGGLVLTYPPQFFFDLQTIEGSLRLYSQGISKFYGLAAIFSFWLFLDARSVHARASWSICCAVFIALALLGGGRGDFIAGIAVILMMGLMGSPLYKIFTILLACGFYVSGTWLVDNFSQSIISLERFSILFQGSSFSEREALFAQALYLVLSEPSCFLIGCGYTYFQVHHSYAYEMYPHNIILEAFITWGVMLVFALFAFTLRGLLRIDKSNPVFWIGVFFFLVALKSGDLFTGWFAVAFIFSLAGIGLASLITDFQRAPVSKAQFPN